MKWTFNKFEELSGREVYEMLKLRVDVFVVEQNCAYHETDGYDYDAIHAFCMDDVGLIAYARLLPAGMKYEGPSVGRVIVKRDKRGAGVAHSLIERSVQHVQQQWKPDKIHLQAQTHLAEFYGGHGFEIVSEPYDDDGIPHVDMVLTTKTNESL